MDPDTAAGPIFADTPFDMTWILRRGAGGLPATLRVGFVSDMAGHAPSDGMYFETQSNAGEPPLRWLAITRAGGNDTETETGIVDDSTYHKFRIRRTAAGEIEYLIDNVQVALHPSTISTSVSMNVAVQVSPGAQVHNDYMSLCFSGLNR